MDFSLEMVLFLLLFERLLQTHPPRPHSLLCFCSASQPHQLHCVCCYSNSAAVLLGIITVRLCRELQLGLRRALPGGGGFLVFEASEVSWGGGLGWLGLVRAGTIACDGQIC